MATSTRLSQGPLRLVAFYRGRPVFRVYVTFGVTLFTIAFFIFFAIRPTVITIFNLIQELNVKKQLTATLDNKIAAIFAAQSVYADAAVKLDVLDDSLPKTPSLGGLLEQVQLLAAIRQVKIRSMSFDQFNLLGGLVPGAVSSASKNSNQGPVAYPFTLSVAGPYSNLSGFVSDLESLRRIIVVKGFGFTQTQNETTGPTITLTISAEVSALGK